VHREPTYLYIHLLTYLPTYLLQFNIYYGQNLTSYIGLLLCVDRHGIWRQWYGVR